MFILILIAAIGLVSCTKELPYEQTYKEEVHTKSLISDEEYIYMPSLDQITRSTNVGLPHFMGLQRS